MTTLTTTAPQRVRAPQRVESYRGIMRDGTSVLIRLAEGSDRESVVRFFNDLSVDSREKRFLSRAFPGDKTINLFCDNSNPLDALTLIATSSTRDGEEIVGLGSYFCESQDAAEIAFVIADAYQGKGLGTLLLEQLAISAIRHGIKRFIALTTTDNVAMIDVLKYSGFAVRDTTVHGDVELQLDLTLTEFAQIKMEARERVATTASLRSFFHPSSVVVVGASRQPSSFGFRVLRSIIQSEYCGKVFAVNPNAREILGVPCYRSVKELPGSIDLAIVIVPRDSVLEVIDDCTSKSIRSVVVISAGFAETGEKGRVLQGQLREKIRRSGMRMIGPNCMGLFNSDPDVKLNATFADSLPPPGKIAMMSQSGALGLAALEVARQTNLGMSMFVSVGNKADISGNDLLQYWETDPRAAAILLYLESFGNPRKFARIARRVSRTKPIVAIKSGRSSAGQRAAGSHTAALAASSTATDALFEQCGIIRAENLEEMFNIAQALGSQPLPMGKKVGIVTNAGGPAILCVDTCESHGLTVPEFSSGTQQLIAEHLSTAASTRNPVDMIASASPEQFGNAIETVLSSREVDSLIVIYVPVIPELSDQSLQAIGSAVARSRRSGQPHIPVLACVMSESLRRHKSLAGNVRIPTYLFPEAPAQTLAKLVKYREWRDTPVGELPDFSGVDFDRISGLCDNALQKDGPGWLGAEEVRQVMDIAGLPVVRSGFAKTPEEAVRVADDIGYPVAVKLASKTITHKSEVGGVRLNLRTADEVAQAFDEIRSQVNAQSPPGAMDGVVIQTMAANGAEVIVGAVSDPLFGPLIAFGLGGTHVEILRDIVFRVTPITTSDASAMIRSIRGYQLLQGFRGQPPADIHAIENVLLKVSALMQEVPQIVEMDLNPVMAFAECRGCAVLDARIRVDRC